MQQRTLLLVNRPSRPLLFFTLPPVMVPRIVFFSADPGTPGVPGTPLMECMEPFTEEVVSELLRSSNGMSVGCEKPDL